MTIFIQEQEVLSIENELGRQSSKLWTNDISIHSTRLSKNDSKLTLTPHTLVGSFYILDIKTKFNLVSWY